MAESTCCIVASDEARPYSVEHATPERIAFGRSLGVGAVWREALEG